MSNSDNQFSKPPPKTVNASAIRRTPANSGINAVHVSAAREMVQLHTRGRLPAGSRETKKTPSPPRVFSSVPPSFSSSSQAPFTLSVSVPAKSHEGECTNPQCAHCGLVIIPSPKSSFPIQDKPSITINDWSIFTIKRPILSLVELDNLETRFEFPLPEMIFGNNKVLLVNEKTGAQIEFNALDALDSLAPDLNLKVSYHKEWLSSRKSNSPARTSNDSLDKAEKAQKENSGKDIGKLTDLESAKPYDWTYSTNYKGTLTNMNFTATEEKLPIYKLLRPDPILFFDESILFEDELADNGISILSTKIRVMPSCLLLLCRFFLRLDNVIFRIRDTRVYIDLESNTVLREYKVQECSYDTLLNKIGNKNANDPKKLLRDVNWVSQNIPTLSVHTESNTVPEL